MSPIAAETFRRSLSKMLGLRDKTEVPDDSNTALIKVSATISPSTVSISNPSATPFQLTLTLRLTNFKDPITMTYDCFLEDGHGCDSSHALYRAVTGVPMPASHIYWGCNMVGEGRVLHPDSELLTLYPESPTNVKTKIGQCACLNADSRMYDLTEGCICRTPLSSLSVGESYQVRPNWNVRWWERGTRERVLEKGSFPLLRWCGHWWHSIAYFLKRQRVEGKVLEDPWELESEMTRSRKIRYWKSKDPQWLKFEIEQWPEILAES